MYKCMYLFFKFTISIIDILNEAIKKQKQWHENNRFELAEECSINNFLG